MQQIFINGVWVDAGTAASLHIVNPATLKALDTVPDSSAGDVTLAVRAACGALGAWSGMPAADRAGLLDKIGERLHAAREELAALLTCESGQPRCEALGCVAAAAALFGRCASLADVNQDIRPGVVAAITSHHFPLLAAAMSAASALAAGSTVVLKPAPQNPLSCLKLAQACRVLPPGVLNVVTGGDETGRALLAHADVARAIFTGSLESADGIVAAARGKPVELRAGPRSVFIVCDDADLDAAIPSITWERLTNAGQACGCAQHLYVDRSIAAEVAERMHVSAGFLDVDDPEKPATDLGPLISLDAAKRVEDQVGRVLRAGARLVLGGRRFRPSGLAGHFFQPTLLTNVRPESVSEDILGPVVTITPVTDVEEALRLARETGCRGASLYCGDAGRVLPALGSGPEDTFRINDPVRGSALGEGLPAGVRRWLLPGARIESAVSVSRKSWWFPYSGRNEAGR